MSDVAIKQAQFLPLLMVYLLRCQQVVSKAAVYLTPDDFNPESEKVEGLLWLVALEFWAEHKSLIPKPTLELAINAKLESDPEYLDETEIDQLIELVELAYSFKDSDFSPSWMLTQLQYFMDDRRLRDKADAVTSADPDKLDAALLELLKSHTISRISAGETVDYLDENNITLSQLPRDPTGVSGMDEVLGGGVRAGEVYGFLGPSGGGKSLVAVHCTSSRAKRHKHTAYFAYENPFHPEYTVRFYSVLAGIPRSRVDGKPNIEALDPTDLAKIKAALRECKPYLHGIDMLKRGAGCGGAQEARSQMLELASKIGEMPSLAVIDQYLPQIDRYVAAHNVKADNVRKLMQQQVDEYMLIATELQTSFLILHQLSPEACAQPPYKRPKMTDSAECKSFAFWMNNCIAMGTQDSEGRCWLVADKARGTAKSAVIARVNGEYQTLEYEADRFRLSGTAFIDSEEEKKMYETRDTDASQSRAFRRKLTLDETS